MGAILQIVVLVAVLAGLVLAGLSYKTMRIYNIVLMVLVFFAAIAFTVLAARTLKLHETWMSQAKIKEAELAQLEKKNLELAEGSRQPGQPLVPGLRQLRLEVQRVALDRGGVWYDVVPEKIIDPDKGSVTVVIDAPEPHGLAEKMVVFVFDGDGYLGEFQVTKASAKSKSVDLAPNLPLDAADAKQLKGRKGPWTLYQMMPLDDAKALAGLTADERQNLLRGADKDKLAELVTEYGDPGRALRSYQAIFHHNNQLASLLQDDIQRIVDNTKTTQAAAAKLAAEIEYLQTEQENLQSDLKNFQREQAAIAAYAVKLQQRIDMVRNYLRAVYAATKQAAADLRTWQLNAAEQMNRRLDAQASAAAVPRP